MNTFLLAIIGIPAIEIYLFIKIGSQIGALNTILLNLSYCLFWYLLCKHEGFNNFEIWDVTNG